MQLLIPISSVDANNVYFSEKRKNVILDGNFIKIIYSTEHFEMNGLHLLLRIYSATNFRFPSTFSLDEQLRALKRVAPDNNKCNQLESAIPLAKSIEYFDQHLVENANQIRALCEFERQIVKNYIDTKSPHKLAVYNLKYQLDGGSFRFTRDTAASKIPLAQNCIIGSDAQPTTRDDLSCVVFALKISGIWETNSSVGITVKFVKIMVN